MQATYNVGLVILSVAVAVLVSFTSLRLAGRVADSKGSAGRAWLWLAGGAMGVGIWSMHFIGMLAFSVPIELRYEVAPTVFSVCISILASAFSIHIVNREELRAGRLGIGSIAMGLGIAAMHYCGMHAIALRPAIEYDVRLVALSIAIAIGASFVALWLLFELRCGRRRFETLANIGASAGMGLAIAGMHYTAMAAARFPFGAICGGGVALDTRWLATIVAMATCALLAIVLVMAVYDAKTAQHARRYARRLERVNQRLAYQARHDALTGLPNRGTFLERLEQAIEHSNESRGLLAVLLVDLDRFKVVNDSMGHGFGDAVLVEVANLLRDTVGIAGCVSRLGGDEFLILIEVKEAREIAGTAARIVQRLSKTYRLGSLDVFLSVSVGITAYPFDNSLPEALISHADEAMYDCKHRGGCGFGFFVPGRTVFTLDRLQLEHDLRHAVELGQLSLDYQPVVDVESGHIVGLEALVRWRHPERGWISPAEFIPIAESSDLIVEIGEWVLHEACRQAHRWVERGFEHLSIAVNVSARQFRKPGLIDAVRAAVERNHLQPRHLVLELTESVFMSDAEGSIRLLQELNQDGFQIAVDDFGTGYSSMNYLKRLPVSKLKIDKSFVQDLGRSAKGTAIVQAVIALAHGLGIAVVAEGVETVGQLNALRAHGCDQYQGYYCSRPRSAAEVTRLLYRTVGETEKPEIAPRLWRTA